ncbi:MAG: HAMP domain-containing protein [Magnetococcales bacterium]|nr:HAMP domain-containing protein [Magnetococcales bacterium]
MNLRTKLVIAQLPWAMALLMLGWFALKNMSDLENHILHLLQINYRSVIASHGMKDALERMDAGVLFSLLGNHAVGAQMTRDHGRVFEQAIKMAMNHIENQDERTALQNTMKRWKHFQEDLEPFFDTNQQVFGKEYYMDRLYPAFLEVKGSVDRVMNLNQTAMASKIDQIPVISQRFRGMLQEAVLSGLAASILATFALQGYVLRGIRILSQVSRRLGEGDTLARAYVTGQDEIALLAKEFNNMANALWEYRLSSMGESLRLKNISQAALDAFPEPVLVFNSQGHLSHWNQAADATLDHLQEGAITVTSEEQELPAWWNHVAPALNYVLNNKKVFHPSQTEEAGILHTLQGESHFQVHGHPLFVEDHFDGGVIVMQDVTYRSRMEEMQRDMLATAAHEFRTPLTSLGLSIHLCLNEMAGPVNEKQAELLQTAQGDCQRLENLVNDLLHLSRLNTGKMELVKVPMVVDRLLAKANADKLDHALDKGVYLNVVGVEPAHLVIMADEDRLLQVLNNLLDNAIRHTDIGGTISLAAMLEGDSIVFQVMDSGQGIPPEYQTRIFECFFQIPNQESGSSGLGLSIAQEIVSLHGGRIGVESTPGQGSLFWFALPVEQVGQEASESSGESRMADGAGTASRSISLA